MKKDKTDSTIPKETKKIKRSPASPEEKEGVLDLAADASNEDDVGGFMDPAGKKKKGRPRKEDAQAKAQAEAVVQARNVQEEIEKIKPLMRPLWETVSAVGVKVAETKEAAIGPNEMVVFVDASAACVQQYLPGLLGTHANAIVLSITLSQYILRVWMLRKMQLEVLRANLGKSVSEAA